MSLKGVQEVWTDPHCNASQCDTQRFPTASKGETIRGVEKQILCCAVAEHTSAPLTSGLASSQRPSSYIHWSCLVCSESYFLRKTHPLFYPLQPKYWHTVESELALLYLLQSAALLSLAKWGRLAGRGAALVQMPSVKVDGPQPVHSWRPEPRPQTEFRLLSGERTLPRRPPPSQRQFVTDAHDPLLCGPKHSLPSGLGWRTEPGTHCCQICSGRLQRSSGAAWQPACCRLLSPVTGK